ncbi:hypothetical protein [Aquipseudomonas alcaligenes]|uniref:hypothetical protein n=1 Tax=Aquipseudomonas alcaligenes TaxID=43263 RepID=UPI0007800121|nr:hypothetical protein [Pseudomonas alcaligenes]AMR67708.1 hypothetical protein A0T30_15525 [Pseudomonas alcaligenes]
MPEKRASFFICLVAGLCLALIWLGGIVFIFSYFRDPVFGDWRGGEPSGLVLAANGLAYLASCFVFAAGTAAIASRHLRNLRAAMTVGGLSLATVVLLLAAFIPFAHFGVRVSY